jgi:predicted dehydrogenase
MVACATRVDVHYDTIKPSVEAGKTTYVEWPLAEHVNRAGELAQIAKQKKNQTLVGLQGRVSPAVVKVKEILQSGQFGKVLSSSVQASTPWSSRDSISEGLAYFIDKKVGGNPVTITIGHRKLLYKTGVEHSQLKWDSD